VFLTYLLVGLGFYKVLDLVKGNAGYYQQRVYALTALLCLVLAVFSIKDYFKARKGELEDMSLICPKRCANVSTLPSTTVKKIGGYALALSSAACSSPCGAGMHRSDLLADHYLHEQRA
jgi:hypothetical protein